VTPSVPHTCLRILEQFGSQPASWSEEAPSTWVVLGSTVSSLVVVVKVSALAGIEEALSTGTMVVSFTVAGRVTAFPT